MLNMQKPGTLLFLKPGSKIIENENCLMKCNKCIKKINNRN